MRKNTSASKTAYVDEAERESQNIMDCDEGDLIEGRGLWYRAKVKRIASALRERNKRIMELEKAVENI